MPRLDAHYRETRRRHGYDDPSFADGPLPARLARTFVAADGDVAGLTDDDTLVTTGVGMTGPPHLGTLGQLLTARQLQAAGVDVQFVLADLEPYHGGRDLEAVRTLAERFRAFALDCGIDPDAGRLRTQETAREVMHTGHLLAPYYDGSHWPDFEPTAWETAVGEAYESVDRPSEGPTSEAASHHSAVLHLADFLHPLRTGYDRVVLAFGIDEHALTPATRAFLADTPVEGSVAGLYTRMVPGLGDAPKMGRSIPESGIHLGMAPDRIRALLTGPEADADRPADSPAFQAMCLASPFDAERLDALEAACRADDEAWAAARDEYAAYVADLAARWQRS